MSVNYECSRPRRGGGKRRAGKLAWCPSGKALAIELTEITEKAGSAGKTKSNEY
jgi:hypothetical protein